MKVVYQETGKTGSLWIKLRKLKSYIKYPCQEKAGVDVFAYTLPGARISTQDINNFNAQYPMLTVKKTIAFHDRFLIIDGVEGYHIGASLKDAGKKCFGMNKIEGTDVVKDIMKKAQQTGT